MTTYTLQQHNVASGYMVIKLHSALAGLTIPTNTTIVDIQPAGERVDALLGQVETEAFTFIFREDYSTYLEGFWFKVMGDYFEIQILLDEGSGNTHFFWGRAVPSKSPMEEVYLGNDGTKVRHGSFVCESLFVRLRDISAASVVDETITSLQYITETTTETTAAGFGNCDFVRLTAIVGSAFYTAFGQAFNGPTYDVTGDSVFDLEFSNDNANWYGWDKLCAFARADAGGGPSTVGFFSNIISPYWGTQFQSAFDLIVAICNDIGVVPRYYYDVTNSLHKMQFMNRLGDGTVNRVTYPVPFSSKYFPNAYVPFGIITSQRVADPRGVQDQRFFKDGSYYTGAIPTTLSADHSYNFQFIQDDDEETYDATFSLTACLFISIAPGNMKRVKYARYNTGGGVYSTTSPVRLRYYGTLFGVERSGYEREYATIKGTFGGVDSHTNSYALKMTDITDTAVKNYHAVEVYKNPFTNKAKIVWHEVDAV